MEIVGYALASGFARRIRRFGRRVSRAGRRRRDGVAVLVMCRNVSRALVVVAVIVVVVVVIAVADAVAVDTSSQSVAALSIYAIQRCAMPFTGENMKTLLCASRCRSRAFRVALPRRRCRSPSRDPLPLLSLTCPCTRSDICLSYVFALRASSRAFPDEGSPVSFTPSRRATSATIARRVHSRRRVSGRKWRHVN